MIRGVDPIYNILLAIFTVAVVPWATVGYLAVRRNSRLLMVLFLLLNIVYM